MERGGGGMGEDEASPQIYVVAVQFVILSGFSLSGKSRWYDGDEGPFKAPTNIPSVIFHKIHFFHYHSILKLNLRIHIYQSN